jgi:hypothetical protein
MFTNSKRKKAKLHCLNRKFDNSKKFAVKLNSGVTQARVSVVKPQARIKNTLIILTKIDM